MKYALVVNSIVSGELSCESARNLLARIVREARKMKLVVKRKKDFDKFLIWNPETCQYDFFTYIRLD